MKRNLSFYFPLSLALVAIFFLFIFFHDNNGIELVNPPKPITIETNSSTTKDPKFSLLIGILTRPDRYDRRHFLRLIYGTQTTTARIDVKFVLCGLKKPEQRTFVALEIMRFDDIIVLNCTENMNEGKTYTYFSSLPRMLEGKKYDYVMKADDDVFLRLGALTSSLEPLPRVDLYYGFVIPCKSQDPFAEYMSGMGFLVSWDLVEWISESEIPKSEIFGSEDRQVGKWLKMGNRGKNRFSDKPAMYDYPGTNGLCSHDLIPQTVAVHRLKTWSQWLHVLHYFNVTKQLKLSTLYHL